VRARFETRLGGQYRVTATVADGRNRPNRTEYRVWASGATRFPGELAWEGVLLVPDKKEYRAGETAEVLVVAPFAPAEGVLTLRRSGLVSAERFAMTGPTTTLRIPISDAYVPNVHARVVLAGSAGRPEHASGAVELKVPPLARALSVRAEPGEAALRPGEKTAVEVEVRDAAGVPVAGAEAAVVVVDEAVLALSNYELTDPVEAFYAAREAGVEDHHSRAMVVSPIGGVISGTPGGVPGGVPAGRAADFLRANFDALALFAPSVVTDAAGRASVEVTLPDNLTRYRVMAVAVAGTRQFGKGESAITARLPLMARPSPPRFLNFGDRFELPVTVQNQTDAPMTVDVAVRAANASLAAGAGRRVTVPPNDRVEVRFPAQAERAGTARFQVAATAGPWSDSAQVSLPVRSPATTEAFAAYGEVDSGAVAQPVTAPRGAIPSFGGLELSTSSTQLQSLTDAVLYLQAYPFECSEQVASRVLSVAALRDVLAAFEAEGLPRPEEMTAAVRGDLEFLAGMQNGDGGWPLWRRGQDSWPFVTVHVAHALERAAERGFAVEEGALERAREYLRAIERRFPSYYGPEARRAVVAYALYVRNRMGERDAARARALVAEAGGVEKLPLEAVGWLLPVLSGDAASATELEAIRRSLAGRAEETAAAAHFVASNGEDDYLLLRSERRADAVVLEGLIGEEPQSDLIPKLARGLLAHRVEGRWANTQENVWVLLALDRYFAVFEKDTPDFVARAWLGDRLAGEHAFRGRRTERHEVEVPMRQLAEGQQTERVTIAKEGSGRLYYRLGLRYAPSDLRLAPYDAGFAVERAYEAVDDPGDVRRDADGTWRVKAGARVRVKLTLAAPSRRFHVALVDPMPAGLESLNPDLAVTATPPEDPRSGEKRPPWYWWTRPWYEHQNLRDDRAEAFARFLAEGVHVYTYVCRATTPGEFVVPPPSAEEMYRPETFGRGSTDRLVVE
jgi:uncharacterized protein YfaS (alpha-2-macroglobulin family)